MKAIHNTSVSSHECQLQLARREISSAVHVSSSEGNFVWETRKCISLILSSDVLLVSSSSDLGMVSSDGVLFCT